MLVVVNEGVLFGAAGGKVHGQTAGDCGACHANINTIVVLSITMRTSVLVDDVNLFQEGNGRTLVVLGYWFCDGVASVVGDIL